MILHPQPLIGCPTIDIARRRQYSDQSEARIPVTALRNSCWCGPRRCRAVPDLHPPIGMLYLVLITSLRIGKTKIHVRNSIKKEDNSLLNDKT